MNYLRCLLTSLLALAGIGPTVADVIFFDDFNGYAPGQASLDATYASRYSSTSTAITIVAGTGLGGSQAWSFSADQTVVRKDSEIDLVNGGNIATASIFFQYPGTGGLAGPQLGFTVSPIGNVTGIGDYSGRLNGSNLELRRDNVSVSTGSALSLTSGNWYQIAYTLERTATVDLFNTSVALFNADANGNVGSLVGSHAASVDVSLVADLDYNDTSLFAVFRENTAITAMDNFEVTVIPEPSSLALATLALGILWASARFRKR